MAIYKKFTTSEFVNVTLPCLKGTQKQIAYANAIRDKYTAIFQRKLDQINPLKKNDRLAFIKRFQDYVDNPVMGESYMWIENHCPRCGCFMHKIEETSYCSNDYCSYQKNNASYTHN